MISSTFIIKSGINIIFGALWLWWIYQLGAKENEDKKCKDIKPMLRIFLISQMVYSQQKPKQLTK